ncbi:spermidine/putrescine ABC transporter ATP-binding protein [Bacillus sp. FJAT-18017]|uniref:ABC transporter ATP-binding protein n=1 Tax=Bacillus sp. FJAT-18017 TaxID=1705566 RepID=UPI0006AFDFF4|nr:ABC transporter ATP-binding protein [Bacillus sp. FJAT-18017]ALC89598.1 spermidine/putrescine ABC transporter ATP-binding protein [Bacillus sp. FJAT-18017]
MSFLSIEGISHTYFTKDMAVTALSNITLSLEEGEFISFLGPSGCGKTTLLSIIAGLIKPTEGYVQLGGKEIEQARSDIGYMLQQDYLFPWKTIEENVLIGLKLSKNLTSKRKAQAIKLLEDIGLPGVEKKLPKQLSGGMRQRAALARTLTAEPKVLMLDEPFSALDYQSKLKLEDLVLTTLKSLGKTAILVTHDIGEAIAMSDRVYLFSASPGRIHKVFDIPEELRKLQPFDTRNHESYGKLFKEIWKELESLE